ncbi:DUF3265 domain-containing protein [Vibrio vulnificus]|nr:DUF3265 domain-containing protein [Vibrio vulnificus]
MTRRLRGIHAAWHFWFAESFGGENGLQKLGLCGTHPLTQRYVLMHLIWTGSHNRYRFSGMFPVVE